MKRVICASRTSRKVQTNLYTPDAEGLRKKKRGIWMWRNKWGMIDEGESPSEIVRHFFLLFVDNSKFSEMQKTLIFNWRNFFLFFSFILSSLSFFLFFFLLSSFPLLVFLLFLKILSHCNKIRLKLYLIQFPSSAVSGETDRVNCKIVDVA